MSECGPQESSAEIIRREQGFWERVTVAWHAVYLGLLAIVGVATLVNDGLSGFEQAIAVGIVAAMVVGYGLFGRRLLGEQGHRGSVAYLTFAWLCFYGLTLATHGNAYILLFVLFPHTWAYLTKRLAVPATVVFVAGLMLITVARDGWTAQAWLDAVPEALLQIGVSLLLGLFILGVVTEGERRAALIQELERTRAELAATEHARGALAERERIAYEIHDTLAQGFTSILTLAQATEAALEDADPDAAHDRLALIERMARENLAEARALVGALGPVDLQGASLAAAVSRVVARFGEETGVPAEVTVAGQTGPLPANAEVVLLRATQEALSNVRKHAAARGVQVLLTFPPDGRGRAQLEITDDGVGFDPLGADGYGLRGMRSRVEQVGGTLEIASGPGAGTRVKVSLH